MRNLAGLDAHEALRKLVSESAQNLRGSSEALFFAKCRIHARAHVASYDGILFR